MNCDAVRDDLRGYLDGVLFGGRLDAVARHLAVCDVCAKRVDRIRSLDGAIRAATPDRGYGASQADAILDRIRESEGGGWVDGVRRSLLPAAKIAAVLLLVVGTALWIDGKLPLYWPFAASPRVVETASGATLERDGAAERLRAEVRLREADVVRAGETPISVYFPVGSRVTLDPGARIRLGKTARAAQEIDLLEAGRIEVSTEGTGPSARRGGLRIRTQAGTIRPIGTHFTVEQVKREEETMRSATRMGGWLVLVTVLAGSVEMENAYGTATAGPGEGIEGTPGGTPVLTSDGRVESAEESEAPASEESGTRTESANPDSEEIENALGMRFRLIPAGEFLMGTSEGGKEGHQPDETQHRVRIARPFYMQTTEVTQAQWEAVMGRNPSYFKGETFPVEQVSWEDCQEFIRRLNAREGGEVYRLPTEAEWEYACRAGTTTQFHFGDSFEDLGEYAWYGGNSDLRTHPVGEKRPNAWGLHDMHGNVLEWCADWYGEYPAGEQTDPTGPATGESRVLRGGDWGFNGVFYLRAGYRSREEPSSRNIYIGFRLAR